MKRYNRNLMIFSFIFAIAFLIMSLLVYTEEKTVSNRPIKYSIVIDAGHGGIDGGAVGKIVKESDINLSIAKKLTKIFEASGFNVVNTRTEDVCLADETSPSFKLDDMRYRREIIQKADPLLLISIHCNKFNLSSCVGAQIFYQEGNKLSENYANIMTEYFVENLPNSRKFPLSGDYYVLDSTKQPAILVECGYLSNPDEEILLASEEYQTEMAYSIYLGTIRFLISSEHFNISIND